MSCVLTPPSPPQPYALSAYQEPAPVTPATELSPASEADDVRRLRSHRAIVNNRAYQVAPGEVRQTEALPAGTVTYQVLEAQPTMQVRTLAAGALHRCDRR